MSVSGPRRRFLIIRNRHAGLANRRLVQAVATELAARGGEARLIETERAAELDKALAGAAEFDAICAAGGDGTLRALAKAISGTAAVERPLALIPSGTGNVMACELGIPRDAPGIADMLLHGPVRPIAGGRANGELFLSMCGAGFDGEVVAHLASRLKERIGRAAYTAPVLRALKLRPVPFTATIDGVGKQATWLVVSNVRHYGGSFIIAPGADVSTPGLHAAVMTATTRSGRVAELLAIASRNPARCRTIEIVPCRTVVIEPPTSLPLEIDGDILGRGALRIETVDRVIDMIVPPSRR
ncbi:MAG: hypothetical protein JNM89_06420 [Hyphomicrobiaceae bacterium]|nr:hypothetical protein [Hyphomicrobiaceae bacterium]